MCECDLPCQAKEVQVGLEVGVDHVHGLQHARVELAALLVDGLTFGDLLLLADVLQR